ncbi:glycosyltransferase family 4 protein [Flavisolibacter ginsenosidimutans]
MEANKTGNCKLLSVVWFKVLPPKFGGQKAVAFFNQHLAKCAPLICLCSKNNESIATNYRIENILPVGKIQVLNPFAWQKIYTAAKREGITHLLLEFPYYGLAGMLCKKLLGVKLVVNTHNIEYLRFKEQKKWWWGLLFHLERLILRAADAVFFKTEADLNAAQRKFDLTPKNLAVIPYGVDEMKGFNKAKARHIVQQKHGVEANERILLFAGTLDYVPNADAVVSVEKNLIPLLNQQSFPYKIIVCGRNRFKKFQYLNDLQNDRLLLAGEVDNIETYFEAADVFINPVLSGGGLQTKTLDALSYHLNVVCFRSKTVGISNAENKIFSVRDGDWNAFASKIIAASQRTTETPQAFFKKYNWRTIAADAYKKILAC